MVAPELDKTEGLFDGMSNDKNSKDQNGGGDIVAAEYVLGLLDATEHEALRRRLADDPALVNDVEFWQQRFASLDESFEEVTPPPAIYNKIEQRLFETTAYSGPFSSLWNNIAVWRGAATGGLAVAVLAAGFALVGPQIQQPADAPTQYVASLEAEDSNAKFLAVYDSGTGHLRLAALSGEVVPDRDYELWFIEGDADPVSLGLVPITGNSELALTDDIRARLAPGTVFAVSLEPKGGSPVGRPTGPVVAAGAATII